MIEFEGELGKELNDFVMLGGTFIIFGDVLVCENEFLKMVVFGLILVEIVGCFGVGNEGSFVFVSDEGALFGVLGSVLLFL